MADDPPLSPELQARSDEAKVAKAEADTAKAKADAAKAAADVTATQRASLAALVPDMSNVVQSKLDAKDGPAISASSLTFGALEKVAGIVADRAGKVLPDTACVLVTSQADLSASDGIYFDVVTGLEQLRHAAQRLRGAAPPTDSELETLGAVDAAAAIATAVPQVLSLFSAQRTLSTSNLTASDLAAASAVAGALQEHEKKPTIVHDDFRLVTDGGVYELATKVSEERQLLIETGLDAVAGDAPKVAMINNLVEAIDSFLAGVHAVPAGATKSPIAIAALRARLHPADGSQSDGNPEGLEARTNGLFTHVLLVKMEAAQSQQVLENRPLWFRDRYSTIVDVSVTFLLVAIPDSNVLAGGVATATASAYGVVGELLTRAVVT
jgi:hypothetical protein